MQGFDGTCNYRYQWSPADLDREDALNVYRMVQEALSNAMRHAHAATIDVELRRNGETWIIEVRDDGRGFLPERRTAGLGLEIMRHRANLVGGKLTIDSAPQAGTTIRCQVPVGRA